MRKSLFLALSLLVTPSLTLAHVSVRPRESKALAEELYTVRVPTEGSVATTHVILEIPSDVAVLEIRRIEGATFEATKEGSRIASITWRKLIPPKAAAEFQFRARNPGAGQIVWKAHQHFADGTVADWIGVAGEKRPAAVTKVASQTLLPGRLALTHQEGLDEQVNAAARCERRHATRPSLSSTGSHGWVVVYLDVRAPVRDGGFSQPHLQQRELALHGGLTDGSDGRLRAVVDVRDV
jgi:uncharacterized protein YcnI